MKKMLCTGRLFLALVPFLTISPAAQAVVTLYNRVFVGSNGNDANNCSNAATPCLGFAGAMAQVQPGGEVIALTTGGFGPIPTITQSVTISGAPGVVAFTAYAVFVNAPGATVVLRGLTIDGTPGYGLFTSAFAALHIENCVFNATGADGIYVSSAGQLFLTDTVVRNANGYGFRLAPGAGTLTAVIEHCRAEKNAGIGFDFEGSGLATIHDSLSAGNGNDGFYIYAPPSTTIDVTLEGCTTSNNTGDGVLSQGAGVTVRISNSTVTRNAGYGFDNILGATFQSRQNNTVEVNVLGQTSGTIGTVTAR